MRISLINWQSQYSHVLNVWKFPLNFAFRSKNDQDYSPSFMRKTPVTFLKLCWSVFWKLESSKVVQLHIKREGTLRDGYLMDRYLIECQRLDFNTVTKKSYTSAKIDKMSFPLPCFRLRCLKMQSNTLIICSSNKNAHSSFPLATRVSSVLKESMEIVKPLSLWRFTFDCACTLSLQKTGRTFKKSSIQEACVQQVLKQLCKLDLVWR